MPSVPIALVQPIWNAQGVMFLYVMLTLIKVYVVGIQRKQQRQTITMLKRQVEVAKVGESKLLGKCAHCSIDITAGTWPTICPHCGKNTTHTHGRIIVEDGVYNLCEEHGCTDKRVGLYKDRV